MEIDLAVPAHDLIAFDHAQLLPIVEAAVDSARPVLGTQSRGPIMNTTQRIASAAATILLLAATPVGATTHEPAPPAEQPAEMQWPPTSTHGLFAVGKRRRTTLAPTRTPAG